MTRVTPYQAGDARDPRQTALTSLAFVLWIVPVLLVIAVATYAATGAPTTSLLSVTSPWPQLRAIVPAAMFGVGAAFACLALARSAVRRPWAVAVALGNGVALVVTGLVVAGPMLAAALGR